MAIKLLSHRGDFIKVLQDTAEFSTLGGQWKELEEVSEIDVVQS